MIDAKQGTIGGRDALVCDGRELHKAFGFLCNLNYYGWIEGEISKSGWVEGMDYDVIADNGTPEFVLSLDVARKIMRPMDDLAADLVVEAERHPDKWAEICAMSAENSRWMREAGLTRDEPEQYGQRPPTREVVIEPAALAQPTQEPLPPPVVTLPCPEPVEAAVEHVPTKTWRKPTAAKLNKVIGPSGKQKDPRQIELFWEHYDEAAHS